MGTLVFKGIKQPKVAKGNVEHKKEVKVLCMTNNSSITVPKLYYFLLKSINNFSYERINYGCDRIIFWFGRSLNRKNQSEIPLLQVVWCCCPERFISLSDVE